MAKTIIDASFSYQRMLSFDPKMARKYFILNLFLPVAHQMAAPSEEEITVSVGLFIAKHSNLYKPVFSYGQNNREQPVFENYYFMEGIPNGAPLLENNYIGYFENLNMELDIYEQSAALKSAFYDCFGNERDCVSLNDCPMIAVLTSTFNSSSQLNVISKTTNAVAMQRFKYDRSCTRMGILASSEKYNGRIYNHLTGEWVGLCDPSDVKCCESCKKIYSSVAADNIYNDRGF